MRTTDADTIAAYFRNRLPVMLDGALRRADDRGVLLRRARLSLGKAGCARVRMLPAEILRETLDAVATPAGAAPKTLAGAAPAGPHHARIWWDERVLDNLDDVLARLDDPRLVLRFYDITGIDPDAGRWHASFDIDVELREAGKTVHFWSADRTYAVDLGYVHADGRFLRLARTNDVTLPRDSAGEPATGATATSRLRPAGDRTAACTAPDAAAKEWAAPPPDSEQSDREAELIVHMLYRAFLLEGPRALRRVPALAMREAGILQSEYAARQSQRQRKAETAPAARPAATFLVQRLDTEPAAAGTAPQTNAGYLPVVAVIPEESAADRDEFEWQENLIRAARGSVFVREAAAAAKALPPVAAGDVAARRSTLIRVAGAEVPAAMFATSVFEAARTLRENLARLGSMQDTRNRFTTPSFAQ